MAVRILNLFRDFRGWFDSHLWYPIKYRTTHRYHILDLREGGNGYGVGWHDSDDQILQANFLILKKFVECEEPFRIIDWDWNEETKVVGEEVKALYRWWTEERAAEHKAVELEWDKRNVSFHFEQVNETAPRMVWTGDDNKDLLQREEELHQKDTEMLIKLMKIRRFLWT